MRNTYCVVFFIITGRQRDSKSHNPIYPRERGNASEHRARARKFPAPEHPGTVFLGYGHGWPKKNPGPPVQIPRLRLREQISPPLGRSHV